MQKYRIYLDHCCYNRPYDDQSQLRISLEAQAKLAIQQMIKDGEVELVTSYWNEFELAANPIEIRRKSIQEFQDEYASAYVSNKADAKIEEIASELQDEGIKYKDACHVACSLISNCDFFISTDDRLLKHTHEGIVLINPVDFIGIVEEEEK